MPGIPSVAIIIVNFNTRNHVLACLASVFKYAKGKKIEVWVVDNGSTDGSADSIKSKFPQVHLIENRQNYFYSRSNNQALKKIRSKYFLILNSDVLLSPKTLSHMLIFMENHPDCGLSGCRQVDNQGKTLTTSHRSHTPFTQIIMLPIFYKFFKNSGMLKNFFYSGWKRRDIREVDTIPGSFMFGRSEILKSVGFFDENMPLFYSDADLCERVRKNGFSIYHVGSTWITHHASQTLLQFPRYHIEHESYRDMVKFYRKHFGQFWSSIIYFATRLAIASDIIFVLKYLKFNLKRLYIAARTWRDQKRLIRQIPQLSRLYPRIRSNYRLLEPFYMDYTAKISPDYMAISLELAAFLLAFCQIMKPRTIADLGTGFSTFVFYMYAKASKSKIQVWSVDDNLLWLKKTRAWLRSHRVRHNNLMSWGKFRNQSSLKFDLILHDLGNMETRIKTLPQVLKMIKPPGFLILDDLQFPEYNFKTYQLINEKNAQIYSLRKFTKDRYDRYGALVHV